MGTPDFAVPSLEILVNAGYEIVGVITATDKYGGRGGKQLIESPVKRYAVEKGLKILQPKNLKAPEFIDELKSLNADIQIVVAFRMLPEIVWNMPELGTFNLHGSLLPKYRGAAPIHWAVINGEKITGVTSFKLKHEIDTGDVLIQEELPIGNDDTTGDVHDKMMVLGAEVVLKTIKLIESGSYKFYPQDASLVTKAPKIYRETSEINFDQNCQKVHDFIRGMSPFPGAYTSIDGIETKILKARLNRSLIAEVPIGHYVSDNKRFFSLKCQEGFIDVLELKVSGKRKMSVEQWLNGYNLKG